MKNMHEVQRHISEDGSHPPEPEVQQATGPHSYRRDPLWWSALAAYVISAIALGEALQALEAQYDGHPVFIRWFNMSCIALMLIPAIACSDAATTLRTAKATWRSTLLNTAITFGGGVAYTLSLKGASVATVSVITRTKSAMILAISVLFLDERMTLPKLATILLSLAACGVLLAKVTMAHSKDNEWWGTALAICCTFCWACGDLVFAVSAAQHFGISFAGTSTFMGISGLWTLAIFWTITLGSFAWEGWGFPQTLHAWLLLLASSVCIAVTNTSVPFGIARSSAFVMGIGGLLTVPGSFIWDYVAHGIVPLWWDYAGAGLIGLAFATIHMSPVAEMNLSQAKLEEPTEPLVGSGDLAASNCNRHHLSDEMRHQ